MMEVWPVLRANDGLKLNMAGGKHEHYYKSNQFIIAANGGNKCKRKTCGKQRVPI